MSGKQEKLMNLISDFHTAMLVTRNSQGEMDARPMAVAKVEEDGHIWFVTDRNSGKVADLILDNEVAVTFQGTRKFISLSGEAHAVDDPARIESLWNETWKVWFPEGKSSSNIMLLRIEPTRGQYWDNSGVQGVKYLIEAGRAYLQGDRPHTNEAQNATVAL